jgi:hypothetical protein
MVMTHAIRPPSRPAGVSCSRDRGTMTKAADARTTKRNGAARPLAVKSVAARKARRATAAQKIIQGSTGWAGDDLEKVIAVVAETRSRSRF